MQPDSSSHSHSHTLTITCTCCYDETKGTQDLKIYSHADSLSCNFQVKFVLRECISQREVASGEIDIAQQLNESTSRAEATIELQRYTHCCLSLYTLLPFTLHTAAFHSTHCCLSLYPTAASHSTHTATYALLPDLTGIIAGMACWNDSHGNRKLIDCVAADGAYAVIQ